jgi:hypothetical protein
MKQATINGIKVNYIPYGDAILLMKGVKELDISNGLIIPYNSIDNGVFNLHGKDYTITLDIQ